jgi:hypothetical protein
MAIVVRRLALVVALLVIGVVGIWLFLDRHGFHSFSEPPRVGEKADAVIQRLGQPHYDSRDDGDAERDYRLGYTDGLGTRHHIRVKDGVVTEITYSSR